MNQDTANEREELQERLAEALSEHNVRNPSPSKMKEIVELNEGLYALRLKDEKELEV